jgi:hypothetical protein
MHQGQLNKQSITRLAFVPHRTASKHTSGLVWVESPSKLGQCSILYSAGPLLDPFQDGAKIPYKADQCKILQRTACVMPLQCWAIVGSPTGLASNESPRGLRQC